MNKIDLNKLNAVVTGGAQGIGFAIAERFVKSGASVCLWDIDNNSAIKSKEFLNEIGKVEFIETDVKDFKSVKIATKIISEDGNTSDSQAEASMGIGFICGILIYIFIFM